MERVDLEREHSAVRQRWRSGGEWDLDAPKIIVGEMMDGGRWYVRRYHGGPDRAIAYRGPHAEHYARGTARRWMRTIGGDWVACR